MADHGVRSQDHPLKHVLHQFSRDHSTHIANANTNEASDAANHRRFNKELGDDTAALGTDGLSDTDFPGTFL